MCYISLQPKIIGNKTSKFLINISINGQRKNYVVISDTYWIAFAPFFVAIQVDLIKEETYSNISLSCKVLSLFQTAYSKSLQRTRQC